MTTARSTQKQQKVLRAIDLFSGCGGLTQGLRDAGFDVLAAIEMNPLATETYKANHFGIPVYTCDIRELSAASLKRSCGLRKGQLDLLAGCPPCQGFSRLLHNNRRERLDDPRNRLIDEVERLVVALLPKTIMLENVPALLQYSRYQAFRRHLRRLGYTVCDKVLDVSHYGVPQRRRRLVVLASRVGEISPPTPTDHRMTVREAIGNLPMVGTTEDLLHTTQIRSERVESIIAAIPKDGGSRAALPKELQLRCHTKSDGFSDVYGRMSWDDVAPTITGGCINPSKGRFLHPDENRAITLREASMLQTFPKTYRFALSKGRYAVAEMIGNALPPAFSAAQALVIKQHLRVANR